MFRKIITTVALFGVMAAAYALPRPSEVRAAIAAGNFIQAESMLNEVVAQKPSPKAHYDLGQVYALEGKHALAVNEFRQAQALDPSVGFASSANEFTKKLGREQSLSTVAVMPPGTNAVPEPMRSHPSAAGGVMLVILAAVIIASVLGAIAYLFIGWKRKREEDQENINSIRDKTSRLLGFLSQLEDALLITKTATYDNATKQAITGRIIALQTTVRKALADIKDGNSVTETRIAELIINVESAVNQAANGIQDAPMATAGGQTVTKQYAEQARPNYPHAEPTVIHHWHDTQVTPQPVVVNNSNDGLLTGILIGEALNQPHGRTVYVEDNRSYTTEEWAPIRAAKEQQRDEYVAAEPAKIDKNDDDNDTYSSSSASSFDSGSSSDDSYSSSSDDSY